MLHSTASGEGNPNLSGPARLRVRTAQGIGATAGGRVRETVGGAGPPADSGASPSARASETARRLVGPVPKAAGGRKQDAGLKRQPRPNRRFGDGARVPGVSERATPPPHRPDVENPAGGTPTS